MEAALAPVSAACAWSACELDLYKRVTARQPSKPRLLLPNSIFLEHAADGAKPGGDCTLTVGNVQAGEPYQLSLVHRLQRAEHPHVQDGPLHVVCEALASTARQVHAHRPCVAILTKPRELLAPRTLVDVCGIGSKLAEEHGVRTVHVSMRELASSRIDASGDLLLGETRLSVVYSRYDFSHPLGRFAASLDEVSDDLRVEWETIERMELSNAVVSSSLGCRLAHRRSVQLALHSPGGLERFLPADEAAAVRELLPHQLHLGRAEDIAEARERLGSADGTPPSACRASSDALVAKNLLRPRTGSGATQDRKASGGMLIKSREAMHALLDDEARRACYIAYPRVEPRAHGATVVHAGEVHTLDGCAASEIASFGALVVDSDGQTVTNAHAGFGVRTRPVSSTHPLAPLLGYGALSCCVAQAG